MSRFNFEVVHGKYILPKAMKTEVMTNDNNTQKKTFPQYKKFNFSNITYRKTHLQIN